jgi:hypothetical protein
MRSFRIVLTVMGVVLFAFTLSSEAQAQATRTWVSGVGDDANPCSRTAPCKTFAGAISKTATGGEINCIDPGGFGAVTITKSITIDGGGTFASILAAGTNGVVINASASSVVTLRNLSINGVGTGLNGIRFLAGATLNVENCVIFGFTTRGIDVSQATTGATTIVKDTNIARCTGAGIRVSTSATPAVAVLDNVRIDKCGTGFDGSGGTRAVIRNSIITQNTTGVVAQVTDSEINIEHSVVSLNVTGIQAGTGASTTVRISNVGVFNNITGLFLNGGSIISFGNNSVFGNSTNGVPSSTVAQV